MDIRAWQQRAIEAGRLRLRQFVDGIHAVDADANHIGSFKALTFGRAHAAEDGVVVHPDDQPVFNLRMLDQHRVTGVERSRDIVGFCRHAVDLRVREAGRLQGIDGAGGATARGIQLIGGDRHHSGVFDIPAALLHLFIEFLPLTGANFARRHHHQRYALHRFALRIDELVIDGNHLHVIATRFGDNRRPELGIGGTDDKALRAAGRQAVNGIQGFLSIRDRNFNNVKA